MSEQDKQWVVKRADSNEELASIVLMLEEKGYTIKTLNFEERIVLAEKSPVERLDD